MSIYKLPLVLDPQPEGGFMVTCPLLPELITEGETVDDALRNAKDALHALIEGFESLGRPLHHGAGLARQGSQDRHGEGCGPSARPRVE